MNEVLLINMIGQLSPELLQDDYMERDMKKGILSFLGKALKKIVKQQYGSSFFQSFSSKNEYKKAIELDKTGSGNKSDDIEAKDAYRNDIVEYDSKHILGQEKNRTDCFNTDADDMSKEDKDSYNLDTRGLNIGIFKRNFRNLTKIISGIAATFVVILSIIIILIKRHKSGIKLLKKSIQVIY